MDKFQTAKKTPWFDGNVKPVRAGVYERKWDSGNFYSRFNGAVWFTSHAAAHVAAETTFMSIRQDLPWRGLAVKP